MPRNDGHHPEHPRRHHAARHSARKGKGLDYKLRRAKRLYLGERCPFCGRPTKDVARHKRTNHTQLGPEMPHQRLVCMRELLAQVRPDRQENHIQVPVAGHRRAPAAQLRRVRQAQVPHRDGRLQLS